MTEHDNTNRGSIWKNDRKEKPTHPDFKGTLNVDGVEYWVSAWKRKPDANPKAPALTFSVQPKEQGTPTSPIRSTDPEPESFDDDIPF